MDLKWLIPACIGFIIFGNHYARDAVGALEKQMESDLNISTIQYASLNSIFFVPNMITPLIAGLITQHVRASTCLLWGVVIAGIGHLLFSFGAQITSLPLLYFGRGIAGTMYEAIDTMPVIILSPLFSDNWNIIVGFLNAFLRLGSVFNFMICPIIYKSSGVRMALWVSSFVATSGIIFAAISRTVEAKVTNLVASSGEVTQPSMSTTTQPSPGANWRQNLAEALPLHRFSRQFYFFLLTATAIYGSMVPFWFMGSKFLQEKYEMPVGYADALMLLPEGAIVIISPITGLVLDALAPSDRNKLLALSVSCLMLPVSYTMLLMGHGRRLEWTSATAPPPAAIATATNNNNPDPCLSFWLHSNHNSTLPFGSAPGTLFGSSDAASRTVTVDTSNTTSYPLIIYNISNSTSNNGTIFYCLRNSSGVYTRYIGPDHTVHWRPSNSSEITALALTAAENEHTQRVVSPDLPVVLSRSAKGFRFRITDRRSLQIGSEPVLAHGRVEGAITAKSVEGLMEDRRGFGFVGLRDLGPTGFSSSSNRFIGAAESTSRIQSISLDASVIGGSRANRATNNSYSSFGSNSGEGSDGSSDSAVSSSVNENYPGDPDMSDGAVYSTRGSHYSANLTEAAGGTVELPIPRDPLGPGAGGVSPEQLWGTDRTQASRPVVWVPPELTMLLLGVSYAFTNTFLWSVITGVVPKEHMGSGNGLIASAMNVLPSAVPPFVVHARGLFSDDESVRCLVVLSIVGCVAYCFALATAWCTPLISESSDKPASFSKIGSPAGSDGDCGEGTNDGDEQQQVFLIEEGLGDEDESSALSIAGAVDDIGSAIVGIQLIGGSKASEPELAAKTEIRHGSKLRSLGSSSAPAPPPQYSKLNTADYDDPGEV